MTVLLILLAASVAVGVLIGVLAKLPPTQLVVACLAMCAAATVFYALSAILG